MSKYSISVITESGKRKIDCDHVLYIETSLQFSKLTLRNKETIEILLTLAEVECILSEHGFFKLSNRFLVNLKYVELVFPANASKIIMEDGKEISVNYKIREELFESLREVYELHELV